MSDKKSNDPDDDKRISIEIISDGSDALVYVDEPTENFAEFLHEVFGK